MGERSADNANLAVVELRKKARRRLVGAIVLALAAAVILPLLLEKEDKPLGDEVSVQIPPVDEGKFVNRLTGRTADKAAARPLPKSEPAPLQKPDASQEPKAEAEPKPETAAAVPAPATSPVAAAPEAPKKSLSGAEQRILSPQPRTPLTTASPSKIEAPVETTPAPSARIATIAAPPQAPPPAPVALPEKTAPMPPEKTAPLPPEKAAPMPPEKAAPVASEKAAPVPPEKAAPVPSEKAAPMPPEKAAPMPTKGDAFAVQIAAFTDDKGANALAARLKKAGFGSTYVEPVQTSRGTLWRVRVGGYPARADADAARAKLKADGWNGIVVMAK